MSDPTLTSRPPAFLSDEHVVATVLIVDDEKLGATKVATMVQKGGHRTILAHSWTEAIQRFAEHDVDLVLMDAVMPNVDGFKLTRMLRERSRSYVPIVFLTGMSDQKARRRCIEAGADDLLTKPVDELELTIRLVAMLRIRRLTRALEEKSRALGQLAKIDGLTGLENRRMLDERLPKEAERARRYGRELSLLMMDVDHFKKVNDTHGHDVGDEVLVCLGGVLRAGVREADFAHRYGGEEFVVLAPETGLDAAVELAERLRGAFHAASAKASVAGAQTLSIGVASLAALPDDIEASGLQSAADAALYDAKRGGRDRVRRCDEDE
ncbi:MAG: diguanylate cyclase [Sandaracinaceae bacterium]